MSRLGIFALWLLHFLPLAVLAPLGQGIGMLAYALIAKRRRIARTNLHLCFPELTSGAREQLLRRHFRTFGRAILESGIAWWGSPERLRNVVRLIGTEHVDAVKGQPVIAFVPHFVGIELEGMRMSLDYRRCSRLCQAKGPLRRCVPQAQARAFSRHPHDPAPGRRESNHLRPAQRSAVAALPRHGPRRARLCLCAVLRRGSRDRPGTIPHCSSRPRSNLTGGSAAAALGDAAMRHGSIPPGRTFPAAMPAPIRGA